LQCIAQVLGCNEAAVLEYCDFLYAFSGRFHVWTFVKNQALAFESVARRIVERDSEGDMTRMYKSFFFDLGQKWESVSVGCLARLDKEVAFVSKRIADLQSKFDAKTTSLKSPLLVWQSHKQDLERSSTTLSAAIAERLKLRFDWIQVCALRAEKASSVGAHS
jgi:hypothetical protein